MITRKNLQIIAISFAVLCFSESLVKANPSPTPAPGDTIKRVGKRVDGSFSSQTAKIFVVDQANRIVRPWAKINDKFETVLQDVDGIRLECTSDVHPVQWFYFGQGAPILTSNVTFTRAKSRNGEALTEYVATALINPPKEHHTGRYICTGTDNFDMRTFFYIYVPGPTLFSALNGQDILIPKNDSKILIPCTVSNPDVIVTLEKSINEVLQRVKPTLVTFDPKEGMRVDISQMDDPEGIYVCTARYNNLVRGIEYTLRYPSNQPRVFPEDLKTTSSEADKKNETTCDKKCGENAHCGKNAKGDAVCVCNAQFKGNPNEPKGCSLDCRAHSDCPLNTVCFSDLKCRDPCIHSIRCGVGASCRVENAYPVCFCPENFVGDPKKECINAVQEDSPSALLRNVSSSFQNQCSRKCGDNAYCTIEKGKDVCKCKPGLAECDIPCMSHDECPDDLSCNVLYKCHSPCIHNIRCGKEANCAVINHRPKCYCPRDTSGDPNKECFSGFQGDQAPSSSPSSSPRAPSPTPHADDKCKRDGECASNERCMKPGVNKGRQCLDPCQTRRCGQGAECKTQDHRTFCACKEGFEGNANRECKPIKYEDGVVEPLRRRPSEPKQINCTKPEECGPFSKCTVDKDGKQKCECLEGHIGEAPTCSQECERNSDCPSNHICLRDSRIPFPYCAKVCGKRICGAGSICREANGVIPADCECPVGYGGDPYLRCQNLNDKVGQDCRMDVECGSTLRCETGASYRKCVDPCDKLKCGENLECSVTDHQASCVCLSGYTGNPRLGCSKDVEFNNFTAANESPCGGLSCGPHSECRIENGQPTCSCRSYARGEPPSCYQECKSSEECELGLSCVQKQCRHACSRCGLNTKCRISRDPTRDSTCSCLDGFEGEPTRGCRPIRA